MTKADSSKPPAKLQTIILKVYIHCEGCRRKVRRIIRVLDGVETVTVDSSTSKVTVTGTVDAKAILERLQKHKKHAEMWPSSNPAGNSSSGKADGNQQPGKPKTTTDGVDNNKKKNNLQAADAGGDKPAAGGAASAEGKKGAAKEVDEVAKGEGGALKSNTPEGAKETTGTNKGGSAATNGSSGGGGGGGNGGGGGKKGGKKGGNGGGNISNGGGGGETDVTGPVNTEPTTTSITANSTDVVVSANKSHAPMTNDSVQTEYAYHSAEYATHMFSDENANNCSIM